MPRKYEQKTYMEQVGRGFWGTILWLLKWVILIVIVLAVIAAIV